MSRFLPLHILLGLSLLIGLSTYGRYGESWDVRSLEHYADASLALYGYVVSGAVPDSALQAESLALGNYGPAFVMLSRLLDRSVRSGDDDAPNDSQHLLYFVTFLAGLAAFYVLCLRWMSPVGATGASILLVSQPVLWGHAFINPKDIPLFALFLLALTVGLALVDRLSDVPRLGLTEWLLLLAWLAPMLLVLLGSGPILSWMERLVIAAAAGTRNLVSHVAADIASAPPEAYVFRYSRAFVRLAFAYMALSLPVLLVVLRRVSSTLFRLVLIILPAAVLLGLVGALRNLGLFAGVLVAGYAVWKHRGRAFPVLLIYFFVASAVLYLLWPYLWLDPAGRLVESVRVMTRYPWTDPVLFGGRNYLASLLPSSYLPVLLLVQFTEPVWPMVIAGLVLGMLRWRAQGGALLLTLAWLVVPLVAAIGSRAVLYDNFRQVLFTLPPAFILTGLAFDRIARKQVAVILIALCALPGVAGIVRLFPYEYVYYNAAVGGVAGAFRNFELDYWGTSYREAAEYLSPLAPQNATVWVEGPAHLFEKYARADLRVFSTHEIERLPGYDFVVATTRFDLDLTSYPAAPVIHSIGRGGAVFSVIKQP